MEEEVAAEEEAAEEEGVGLSEGADDEVGGG